MKKSIYYDFCQKDRRLHRIIWIIQSLIFFWKVSYYWDKKQKAYCREIKNVRGKIIDGWFYPRSMLVTYKQRV